MGLYLWFCRGVLAHHLLYFLYGCFNHGDAVEKETLDFSGVCTEFSITGLLEMTEVASKRGEEIGVGLDGHEFFQT